MLKKSPPPPTPTTEQAEIFAHAAATSENFMISALAGTGKTEALKQIQTKVSQKPVLYLVFNTDNAIKAMSLDQIRKEHRTIKDGHSKAPEDRMLSTTDVRTLNGQGHRVWMSGGRSITLDGKKTQAQLRDFITDSPKSHRAELWRVYDQVVSGVGLAKSIGYIPSGVARAENSLVDQSTFHQALDESPDDIVSDTIDAILRKSIVRAYSGYIDYNDQVYMSALFGGSFPKYPLVMVDEFQDLSPVDHAFLARLVRGRLIGVGDPWQNIYGFRGASAAGMLDAIGKYRMGKFNLSISFRCPSAIVEHVHWRVPHFKAFREGGVVETPVELVASDIPDATTIICRNNAPLFALAFRLISAGHSVSVAGSDIGPRLVGIMKRLGDGEMSQRQTLSAIGDWEAEKVANDSTSAPDMAECMRIFARQGDSLSLAISYAEHLFKQQGSIKLMTGHKAKGLEFDHVIHLDPWILKETEQDLNLRYVISTRSRDTLIEIDSARIKW